MEFIIYEQAPNCNPLQKSTLHIAVQGAFLFLSLYHGAAPAVPLHPVPSAGKAYPLGNGALFLVLVPDVKLQINIPPFPVGAVGAPQRLDGKDLFRAIASCQIFLGQFVGIPIKDRGGKAAPAGARIPANRQSVDAPHAKNQQGRRQRRKPRPEHTHR